jgi:hypothetical protein
VVSISLVNLFDLLLGYLVMHKILLRERWLREWVTLNLPLIEFCETFIQSFLRGGQLIKLRYRPELFWFECLWRWHCLSLKRDLTLAKMQL